MNQDEFDRLIENISKQTTVETSVVALLNGISSMVPTLKKGNNTSEFFDLLNLNTKRLADAVVINTV